MKALLPLIFISTLTGVVAANTTESPPATPSAVDAVLQSTGFGPEDGYAPGSLDGQRGWITLGQPATIVPTDAIQDSSDATASASINMLQLAQGSDSWAAHWLPPSQSVRIDIMMELFASPSAHQGTRLGIGDLVFGFVLNEAGTQARVEYLRDGTLAPVDFPQVLPACADGALGWSFVGLHLDFDSKLWDLSINGLVIAEHQPLADTGSDDVLFMMSAGESNSAQVASVSVQEVLPFDNTVMPDRLGRSAANDGAGTSFVISQQKLPSYTVAAAMSSQGGGQASPMGTSGNNAQPTFFTIFSPN